jgi:transglutaminase-like putative cysteine protease
MIYRVSHTTTYEYGAPVLIGQNLVHLTPRTSTHQSCLHQRLLIEPVPGLTSARHDYFGNPATFFAIQEPHRKMIVTAESVVDVKRFVPHDAAGKQPWEQVRDRVANDRGPLMLDAYQFVFDSRYIQCSSDLASYAAPSFAAGRPLLEAVMDLTRRIHSDFQYDQQATTLATPLCDVLTNRRGVCQDFAHLQIGCLRSMGVPARYVSGYLRTRPNPGRPPTVGAHASHAWLSVSCAEFGWIDVDPTNNLIPSDTHITLAWGRDYDDVSPIKGVILGGGHHTVAVAVDVVEQ